MLYEHLQFCCPVIQHSWRESMLNVLDEHMDPCQICRGSDDKLTLITCDLKALVIWCLPS